MLRSPVAKSDCPPRDTALTKGVTSTYSMFVGNTIRTRCRLRAPSVHNPNALGNVLGDCKPPDGQLLAGQWR